MIGGKIGEELSNKFSITKKNALCVALMDDFFDDAKNFVSGTWGRMKQYARDNKHIILPLVSNLLGTVHPSLGQIPLGGNINS